MGDVGGHFQNPGIEVNATFLIAAPWAARQAAVAAGTKRGPGYRDSVTLRLVCSVIPVPESRCVTASTVVQLKAGLSSSVFSVYFKAPGFSPLRASQRAPKGRPTRVTVLSLAQ